MSNIPRFNKWINQRQQVEEAVSPAVELAKPEDETLPHAENRDNDPDVIKGKKMFNSIVKSLERFKIVS